MSDDWAQLARVAGAMRDRDLARVEKIVAHMNRIRSDIAQIQAARTMRPSDRVDPARLTGADMVWRGWSEDKLARLQAQLAALRASHETALAEARRAFGRAEVAEKMARDGG